MNSKVEHWLTIATLVGWGASIGSMVLLSGQVRSPNVAIPRLTPPATAGTLQISGERQKNVPQDESLQNVPSNANARSFSSNSANTRQ
jgi:hypothetical protein